MDSSADPRNTVKIRNSLTIQEKITIIQEIENGKKNYHISQEYNLPHSTVSTILRNKETIKKNYELLHERGGNMKRKRFNGTENDVFDKAVYAWFCQKISTGEPVSSILLKEKAMEYHQRLKKEGQIAENSPDFKASDGWLGKFKIRYDLRTIHVKGEKASVEFEASADFTKTFQNFIVENEYDLDNVYSADESGLFYRYLPDRELVLPHEKEVSGHKPMKERVTFLICANATGTDRLPLLVIGRAAKPRCFKNAQELPLLYKAQKKAWMDTALFWDWYKNLYVPHVTQRKPSGRFLLLLDNAPTHPKAEELNAFDLRCQVMYLPPNVTTLVQPMDQGVISATKRHYKKGLLRELLSKNHFTNQDVVTFLKKWSVLDCMKILKEAWETFSPSTLGNAWKKILPDLKEDSENIPSSNNDIVTLLNHVPGGEQFSLSDVDKWLGEDETLQTCRVLTDEEILNSCAGLNLPLPEDTEEDPGNDDDDVDGNVIDAPESQTLSVVYDAARILLDWSKKHTEFSNEDVAVLYKMRNFAFDKMLDIQHL